MVLGFGGQKQQPMPSNNSPPSIGGDSYNIDGAGVSADWSKSILKVDFFKLIFYEAFAGWREVEEDIEIEFGGRVKSSTVKKYVVDYDSRLMNEKGANYLYNIIFPLISSATTTSKLENNNIYNNWKGKLLTIRMSMLSQYYFPKLRCKECEYVTENSASLREHQRVFKHKLYTKTINQYGLDIDRYPDVVSTIANMSTITHKAVGGFTTRQVTENYVNTNSQASQQMAMMQQPIPQMRPVDVLLGRQRKDQ